MQNDYEVVYASSIVLLFILFLLGLFVGSFLLVVVDRIHKGEPFFIGRSRCDACHKVIRWYDLIPLFSYFSLKGKCRTCGSHVSLYYPIAEFGTGLSFVITAIFIQNSYVIGPYSSSNLFVFLAFSLLFVMTSIVIFLTDIKYGIIPFRVMLFSIFLTLFYFIIISPSVIFPHLIAAAISFLFFFFLFFATKGRGMGFGDVVYAFFMGLLLGFPFIIYAHYIAFLTGAIISLILIIAKKKKLSGGTIPFGPFLVIGAYISLFLGNYLSIIVLKLLHY